MCPHYVTPLMQPELGTEKEKCERQRHQLATKNTQRPTPDNQKPVKTTDTWYLDNQQSALDNQNTTTRNKQLPTTAALDNHHQHQTRLRRGWRLVYGGLETRLRRERLVYGGEARLRKGDSPTERVTRLQGDTCLRREWLLYERGDLSTEGETRLRIVQGEEPGLRRGDSSMEWRGGLVYRGGDSFTEH
jgi:hypothetical protein